MKATGAALVAKEDLKEPISILVMVSACCPRDCNVATCNKRQFLDVVSRGLFALTNCTK